MRKSDHTVTPAENEVLEILRSGPAETSGHTEASARYRLVSHSVCRRLERAGLVEVDGAGVARLSNSTDR